MSVKTTWMPTRWDIISCKEHGTWYYLFIRPTEEPIAKGYFTKLWNTAFLLYCITQIVVQFVSLCPCHRKTWHCWQRNGLHILPHAVNDAWKPSTATVSTKRQQTANNHIIRIQLTFVLFDAMWQGNMGENKNVALLRVMVCVAVSPHHLCYRVTFSRGPSVWHVAWWQTNLSNMCTCRRGMKNDVTCSSWRANEFICLLLPFKRRSIMANTFPKMLLGKVWLWNEWKADGSSPTVTLNIGRYLPNSIHIGIV